MSRYAALCREVDTGELVRTLDDELGSLITVGRLFIPSRPLDVDGSTEAVIYLTAPTGFVNAAGEVTGKADAVAELGHLGLMFRFSYSSDAPGPDDWHWFGFYEPGEHQGLKTWAPVILGGPQLGQQPVGPHRFPPPGAEPSLGESMRARFTLTIPTSRRRWLQLVWSPEIRRLMPGSVALRLGYHVEAHSGPIAPSVSPVHTTLKLDVELPSEGDEPRLRPL
jgi:hypothetical protein